MKKIIVCLTVLLLALSFTFASGSQSNHKIGVPDDATNQARAIKLLERAGLITVDPASGFTPELKDITSYIYDIEIVPATANTLASTLGDYVASTVNGTYAIPYGLVPSKDALIIESQSKGETNPYVNIIVARESDIDKSEYQAIKNAYQTELVAKYQLAKYNEAYFPVFDYVDNNEFTYETALSTVDNYKIEKGSKRVIKVGLVGGANDQWKAVQYELDRANANIYLEWVDFDAYNLPNEALNAGDIDINAFQHYAFLNEEVATQGYKIKVLGDTYIDPLSLYSKKVSSLDELKTLVGKK